MRAAAILLVLGCAHAPPPHVDAPNWLLWGRKPTGAPVAYPDGAWNAGVEGEVAAEVCVDRSGATKDIRIVSGPPLLGEAVQTALATWSFEPLAQGPGCFERRFRFEHDPEPDAFFRTDGEMIVTRAYHPPRPDYVPPIAPIDVDGSIYLRVCTDEQGQVRDATVMKGLSSDADDKVARAVMGWRYRAARLRGKAVPACWIERFLLHPGQSPQPMIPNAPVK